MFYLILLIFTILMSFIKIKTNKNKLIDLIILSYMTIVYAIRYNVGSDYLEYQKHYYNYDNSEINFEFLFQKAMDIFNALNAPFFIFMLFIGLIIYILLYLISNDLNIKYDYLIICFITTGAMFISFNFIRQILSGLIVAYSFKYITKKKLLKYLIINAIAILVHNSALIFVPFYFIAQIQLNRKKWIVLFFIGLTLYFTNNFNLSLKILFPSKYINYFNSKFDVKVTFGLGVLMYIGVALRLILISIDKKNKIYPFTMMYISGYTILLFLFTSRILTRITVFSLFYIIFIIPSIYQYCESNEFIESKKIKGPNFVNKLIELNNSKTINKTLNILMIIAFFGLFISKIINIETVDSYNLLYQTIFNKIEIQSPIIL